MNLSVSPQTVVLGLRLARTRNFFGIDQMSCPPIALNESPCTGHVNGVPTVPESIVLEANTRLIAGRFAVTLYHHAMQSSITEGKKYRNALFEFLHGKNYRYVSNFDKEKEKNMDTPLGMNYYFGRVVRKIERSQSVYLHNRLNRTW